MELGVISNNKSDLSSVAEGFTFPNFSGASTSELLGLMSEADALRRRLEGYLVGLVSRYSQLEGHSAAVSVCHQFGISSYKARQLAKTAESLKAVPNVFNAIQQGRLSVEQGAMIAESHNKAPISEQEQQELLELSGWQNHDDYKKTVAAYEDQRRAADGMSRTERQQARRSLKVFDSANGMVVLHAELDPIAGDRIKIALSAMSSKMIIDDTAYNPERTFEQRNADALVALITQQPANPSTTGAVGGCYDTVIRPQKTTLIVSVDYDAINSRLTAAGLIDGTPIDLNEIRRLACDADIVPMILSTDAQPLYLGQTQRTPTKAQKLALYRRDRGCISCGIHPTACDIHHINPWEHNGTTNINNLVLLCPKCHRKTHKHNYTIKRNNQTGRHTLLPPPQHNLPPPPTTIQTPPAA